MRRALAALAVCTAAGAAEEIGAGITFRSFTKPEGPFRVFVLEVDPANPAINILPVRAHDRAAGRVVCEDAESFRVQSARFCRSCRMSVRVFSSVRFPSASNRSAAWPIITSG